MSIVQSESLTAYPERPRRRSLGSRIRKVLRGVRWNFALSLIRSAFYIAKAGGRTYEPVEIKGRRFANVRDSDERWQAVSSALREYGARNVLDVGCAEGWFVRRAATDNQCFAIGIESTDVGIVGELTRLHDRVERSAIVRTFVTPDTIRSFPKFDAVLCMSVVHHVVRAFGIASGEQFLRALATRTDKVFIFEIGTADESSWTPFMPEQHDGQEAFVRNLLSRCGFKNIRVIGKTAAFHREVERLLFLAEPASGDTEIAADVDTALDQGRGASSSHSILSMTQPSASKSMSQSRSL
ncbi:MAG TPA: DUF1698 domain-containing protein [Methyloceanibacter sp.]|nr:DUF1698 domain-containing protein [Methyloceanibacter sp.]